MTRCSARGGWPLLVSVLLMPTASVSVAAETLPEALQRCREQQDDRRRLECFDRESARLAIGTETATARVSAAAVATAAATPSAPATAEQRFGFRGDVARDALDSRRNAEPTLEKLQAKVTTVLTNPTGYWTVTLDNGQQWSQVPMGTRVRVDTGEAVAIVPLALGSFTMILESGQSIRVRRRR